MARNLWISSEMQKCFEECTQKEDYGALRNCWKDVLWVPDEVKNVKLHNNHHAQFMAEEMGELINYLISYKPHYRWEVSARSTEQLEYITAMDEDIRSAISNKNWEHFFKKYRDTMDYIIREAREQKLIDFSIEHNGKWYNSLGSWYSAKYTVPLKPDLKPVRITRTICMLITERMIRSFKECTLRQDYKLFYEENRKFITDLSEKLENHFRYSHESSRYNKFLAQSFKITFCYLTKLDAQNPNAVIPGGYGMSTEAIQLRSALKQAFLKKDWSEFYQRYRWDFIEIIRVARERRVLDLKVETEKGKFETFEKWAETGKTSSMMVNDSYHPMDTKNHGTMITRGGDSTNCFRDSSTLRYICCVGEKTRSPSPPVELVCATRAAFHKNFRPLSSAKTPSRSSFSCSFGLSREDWPSENHRLTARSGNDELHDDDERSVMSNLRRRKWNSHLEYPFLIKPSEDRQISQSPSQRIESPDETMAASFAIENRESSPTEQDVLVEGFVNASPQNRNTEILYVSPIGPIGAKQTTHVLDTSHSSVNAVSPSAAPIEERHFIDDSMDSSDTPSPIKRGFSSMISIVKCQLETTKTNHIGTTDALIEEEPEDVDDYHQSEEFIALKKKLDDAATLRDTLNKVEEESQLNIPADRPRTLSEGVTSSDDHSEGREETSNIQEEEEEEKIEMLEDLDKSPNASSTIVGDSFHPGNSKSSSTTVNNGGDSSNCSLDFSTISSFSWCAEEETPCPLQPDEPVDDAKQVEEEATLKIPADRHRMDSNKEGESADDPVDSSMMSMVMRQLEATKTNHVGKTDVLIEEEPEDVDDYQQSEQYIAFKERLEAAARLRNDVKQVEEEAKLNIPAERRPASSERVTSSDGLSEFEERLRAQGEQFARELNEKKEERRRKQLEREEEFRKAKENRKPI